MESSQQVAFCKADATEGIGLGIEPQAGGDAITMATVNYDAEAELFAPQSRKFGTGPMDYKRFDSAAEAIRFAIEELPAELLRGAYLEVEEDRFDGSAIRRFYESEAYPLQRHRKSEGRA
jgi:hypothetical protein